MGCWDYMILCDDTALDALDELNSENIEQFLDEAINSDYLDYDVCEYGLVAAAIVDVALNGINYDILTGYEDEEIEETVCIIEHSHAEKLRQKSIDAICAVKGKNSELFELMSENGEDNEFYINWVNNLNKIIERLSK